MNESEKEEDEMGIYVVQSEGKEEKKKTKIRETKLVRSAVATGKKEVYGCRKTRTLGFMSFSL